MFHRLTCKSQHAGADSLQCLGQRQGRALAQRAAEPPWRNSLAMLEALGAVQLGCLSQLIELSYNEGGGREGGGKEGLRTKGSGVRGIDDGISVMN